MRHATLCAAVILLAAALVVPVRAELANNLSLRADDDLAKLAGQLESRFAKRSALKDEPRVTLLADDVIVTDKQTQSLVRGLVVRLGVKPDGDYTRECEVDPEADLADIGVWVVRGGKVRRSEGEAWSEITRDGARYLVFRVGDVKKGDQVGLAYTENRSRPFQALTLPAWEDDPLMMRRLRVQAEGDAAYRIEGWRLPRDDWSLKTITEKEGMPVDERLTLVDVAAANALPEGTPPWSQLPFLLVSPRAAWVEEMKVWVETVSWNEIAVTLSGLRDAADEQAASFATRANEIVGTETEPAARMAALTSWLQEHRSPRPLFGRARRTGELIEVLDDGVVSPADVSRLLYALGRSLGLELDLLFCRRSDLGVIKRNQPSLFQFTDIIVRLPGDTPLYYFPAAPDGHPGQLPAFFHGCDALPARTGLVEEARTLQRDAMISAASPDLILTKIKEAFAAADYARWETLP